MTTDEDEPEDARATWARHLREETSTSARMRAKAEREELEEAKTYAKQTAPFRFDKEKRAELQSLLGSAAIVDDLERVVTTYRRDPELDEVALPRDLRRRLTAAQKDLERLGKTLAKLPRDIEYVYRDAPTSAGLRMLALELRRLLRWERKPGQKTAAPTVRMRDHFARVLRRHGIRITLTRNSRVQEAYRIVHEAVTGRPLGDDILRSVLRPLRHK